MHEALNLQEWPFTLVPSKRTAAVWVGRPELRRELRMLLRTASAVADSQLVMLWSDFGQGKTHALRHLEGLARLEPDIIPVYAALPKGIRSFTDVYRAIADQLLESGVLVAAGRDLFDRTGGVVHTDLERALLRIGMYPEDEGGVAAAWFRAEKAYARDLKDLGIGQAIKDTADAIQVLNDLVKILTMDRPARFLLLLDEVQELAELSRQRLDECRGGLHKVYDRNTEGLTMVLSFTAASQDTLKKTIGSALFDRVADTLTIPSIDRQDAIDLIEGLLAEWSIDRTKVPFPFTKECIERVIDAVADAFDELTPRRVIKPFNKLLRSAQLDIEDGIIREIDANYAKERLTFEPEDLDEE